MELVIYENDAEGWVGDFNVLSTTGAFAEQNGDFIGTVNGRTITASCTTTDDVSFQLIGTTGADGSLVLTRSDLPGQPLTFKPVKVGTTGVRSLVTFHFDSLTATSGPDARIEMSSTPAIVLFGVSEYRGKFIPTSSPTLNFDCRLVTFPDGKTELKVNMQPATSLTSIFRNYSIKDVTSKTVEDAASISVMPNLPSGKTVRFFFEAKCKP